MSFPGTLGGGEGTHTQGGGISRPCPQYPRGKKRKNEIKIIKEGHIQRSGLNPRRFCFLGGVRYLPCGPSRPEVPTRGVGSIQFGGWGAAASPRYSDMWVKSGEKCEFRGISMVGRYFELILTSQHLRLVSWNYAPGPDLKVVPKALYVVPLPFKNPV